MTLVFATHNDHKVLELRQLLPPQIKLYSLTDIGCHEEIPETGNTLEANAKIKADFVKYKYGLDCFADDSGLEIEVLGGAPGVHSARFAGEQKDNEANINKVWQKLSGQSNSEACFKTLIFAHIHNQSYSFEGRVDGNIIRERKGDGGFGYDPIFVPKGYDKTFAELGESIKNQISHRAKATASLLSTLQHMIQ
ncbi:MAG: non-canonical purine NTP diphosphatase [Bacteroidetes bacterium]|nr:non-canonical purine NTP diphosphatase [Bacteroidota bacterium]MDA0922136.1 non-canonical purine NTP diphosphatase [Bacteroidota bacterium]MDA1287961.1 non-canonical purine NTP diphosphatase [Bacteroidota bacterium]